MIQEWYTAGRLKDLALPGLPDSESGIIRHAKRHGWGRPEAEWHPEENPRGVWRRRTGQKGGGVEYHYSLFPAEAQAQLGVVMGRQPPAKPAAERVAAKADLAVAETWSWFERQPDKTKAKARERLETLDAVETMTRGGIRKEQAIPMVAAGRCSASSIWGWYNRVQGRDRHDWLPFLADRYAGRTAEAECAPEAWETFKADFLRLEKPTAESCYERLQRTAKAQGWAVPSLKTLMRRINAIPLPVRVLAREGADELKKLYPAQERDRSVFHALEAVNGDGHIVDVFVKWPDGEVRRPVIVAFQDVYSGKWLAWRVDKTENTEVIRLALGDLVEDHGIPDRIFFDNTRAFANKSISGGTQTRFRFKVRDEDPVGLAALLGSRICFVLPYSGQSKPIERSFRDQADRIAKHPAFAGAYTGNKPDAKPENYGSKAVPLDEFLKVVAAEIAAHNARPGRRTKVCQGRSFDEVFAESYERSPIRKATPEQRRLWLLAAEGVRADATNGAVKLMGNRYWAEFLVEHRGQPLVIRFDPQDLVANLHVYDLAGVYLGEAECIEAAGFADAGAARAHARARRAFIKAQKDYLAAERRLTAAEVADQLPEPEEPIAPETKVVALTFGNTALKPQPVSSQDTVLDAFTAAVHRLRPVDDLN